MGKEDVILLWSVRGLGKNSQTRSISESDEFTKNKKQR